MKKSLGWGVLATGWIAELFTHDLVASGLNVAAVGSRSGKTADAFARRFGIPRAHGSYQALVTDPDVDIIYVATPHPQHAQAALLALEAGKHVLIEKPFTLNADEARTIVKRAREKNLVVLEAMWTRFLPHMKRIHEIIDSGVLGELRSVTAEHRQFLSTDPKHRLNAPELGGGALLDLGIYPLSFAFDILGAPTSITATARFKDTGVDAEIATIMQHQGGAISTSVSALDCAGPNAAAIYGSKARIVIAPVWYAPTSFRLEDYQGNVLEDYAETVAERGMQFQAFEMERLVRTGTASAIMPPDESVLIMETLDTIRKQIGLVYPGEDPGKDRQVQ
ncbi:Gfo/Idh/MocA family oxidoreductase [Sodalis ligni]|uniref:Gfo/Idh/MocA family protein n=1 Tax=Sodalis ligni TaxID=2697027 RepID=UPI00193F2BDA|nr:Gfo/Idh/MocA family oxidoreductase [Sodalis ligni]QWA13180.1 Gfo/Idh/MocA family oxidoreductase [Sodalis ligni]